jgi:hypothetical protein
VSGVFRNIDPPPPNRPASVYPLAFGAGGGHTRQGDRGWGVNSSEDARQCSILYIGKYFVIQVIGADRRAQVRPTCSRFEQYGAMGRTSG